MVALTQKQIKVLKVLAEREYVVAPWSHQDLNVLESAKYAISGTAYQTSGRLSSNKLWSISERGRDFLDTEHNRQSGAAISAPRWEPDF